MECLPAIDLRGGRSVRLLRGDFRAETVYGDPVEQAVRYEAAGASILHVVDLDAARTGDPVNARVIAAIRDAVAIPIEVGGGVRDERRADELIGAGIDRVVLGTRAVEDPEFAAKLAAAYPGQIVLGCDYRRVEPPGIRGVYALEVAVRGWEAGSGIAMASLLGHFVDAPLAAVVATDIGQDGTLEGPDLAGYRTLLELSDHPIVASGGVGTIGHLRVLRALDVDGRNLAGVIVGKALVEGRFTVEEAVAACRR